MVERIRSHRGISVFTTNVMDLVILQESSVADSSIVVTLVVGKESDRAYGRVVAANKVVTEGEVTRGRVGHAGVIDQRFLTQIGIGAGAALLATRLDLD